MAGLFVLGAVSAADAAGVAASVARALGTEAQPVHEFPGAASPLTAARHAGATIEPRGLVFSLREYGDPLVLHAGAGLLAPLTPRYSMRDLAHGLGLPVVLAVPAGPDVVGLARIAIESARGAGLRVPAVVITGWPDPPSRVLLDERRLLDDLVAADVVTLPDPRAWPVEAWVDAPDPGPAATAPAASRPAAVVLDDYRTWEPRTVGDPRATPRPQIMEAMLEIVGAEGPILASRAFALYNRASGGKKLTTIARAPLSSAIHWLAQEGRVVLVRREEIPWQDDDLVRLPDAPEVLVRELGPRTLEEVPLDEIAELMRRQAAGDGPAAKRAVLDTYGLKRLTTRADAYLELAVGLAQG